MEDMILEPVAEATEVTPVQETEVKEVKEKKSRTSVKQLEAENEKLQGMVNDLLEKNQQLKDYNDSVFATSNDMSNRLNITVNQLKEQKQYITMLSTSLELLAKSIDKTLLYLGGK